MAIYSNQVKIVSKSAGHSAVASSLYQSRETGIHYQQQLASIEKEHRKTLNKGIVDDNLRQTLKKNGVNLSENAAITKDGRRKWTIQDDKDTYTVKEYRKTELEKDKDGNKLINPETGKSKRKEIISLDVHADKHYDYRKKAKEDLLAKWIDTPDGAENLEGIKDRSTLWSAGENMENRNGQSAGKFILALPKEHSEEQNIALMKDFVQRELTSKGAIADIAIHCDKEGNNPHAHVMYTTRKLSVNDKGEWTFAKDKNHDLNTSWKNYKERKSIIVEMRKSWADVQNKHLRDNGYPHIQIDHRSYEEQGISKIPTRHVGKRPEVAQRVTIENGVIERTNRIIERHDPIRDKFNQPAKPDKDWVIEKVLRNVPQSQKEHETVTKEQTEPTSLPFNDNAQGKTVSEPDYDDEIKKSLMRHVPQQSEKQPQERNHTYPEPSR